MKPGIHPTWYPDAVVTCACGNTWTTGSTKKEIHTDVCNKCHPFFTGEQRIVDTAGQVERFMKRINAKETIAATQPAPEEKKAKKEKRRARRTPVEEPAPVPAAPAELPRAEVDVATIAPVEDFKPERNEELPPAGMIGDVASVDRIIEPTEAAEQPKARAPRKPRKAKEPKAEEPKAEEQKPEEKPEGNTEG